MVRDFKKELMRLDQSQVQGQTQELYVKKN
jgi:hypothetical protein